MALNIRDKEAERLVKEVNRLTGESATEAVRKALEIRLAEIKPKENLEYLMHVLEEKIWSKLPVEYQPLSQEEVEKILGYGPEGC